MGNSHRFSVQSRPAAEMEEGPADGGESGGGEQRDSRHHQEAPRRDQRQQHQQQQQHLRPPEQQQQQHPPHPHRLGAVSPGGVESSKEKLHRSLHQLEIDLGRVKELLKVDHARLNVQLIFFVKKIFDFFKADSFRTHRINPRRESRWGKNSNINL